MAFSVLDGDGNVVAGDVINDAALQAAADAFPGGKIRDDSTGQIVYESDDEEHQPMSVEDARRLAQEGGM